MPSPPTRRQKIRSQTPNANPVPMALTRNSSAPSFMAGIRP